VDFIASAALSGLDPMLWLDEVDDMRMTYLRTIGKRMIDIDELRRKNQAQHIINELAKSLNRGNRQARQGQSTSSTHGNT
jgi:hypothetical protein